MNDPVELCTQAVECYTTDPARAAELFREAAEAGHPNGYFGLAEMFLGGHGVERDPKAALELYRVAAEAGHPPAMYRLGTLYSGEMDIDEDVEQCR